MCSKLPIFILEIDFPTPPLMNAMLFFKKKKQNLAPGLCLDSWTLKAATSRGEAPASSRVMSSN